jgi:hypothetical protein
MWGGRIVVMGLIASLKQHQQEIHYTMAARASTTVLLVYGREFD